MFLLELNLNLETPDYLIWLIGESGIFHRSVISLTSARKEGIVWQMLFLFKSPGSPLRQINQATVCLIKHLF